MKTRDGRVLIVITGVHPEIDYGRFPIKRTVGEPVVVEADIFADGRDALSGVVLYRHEKETQSLPLYQGGVYRALLEQSVAYHHRLMSTFLHYAAGHISPMLEESLLT